MDGVGCMKKCVLKGMDRCACCGGCCGISHRPAALRAVSYTCNIA